MFQQIRWIVFAVFLVPALVFSLPGDQSSAKADGNSGVRESFDRAGEDGLPEGWMIDETRGSGKTAIWKISGDQATSDDGKVLKVIPSKDASGGTFNLCRTDGISFLDGEIRVSLRADSGREDQGGGPMWRVQDGNNYYVARYNPLENNFRLYKVSKGVRRMLKSAGGIEIPAGEWFTIRIIQNGSHIQCFLNGTRYLEADDTTFPGAGGVGLWSKADAATSFDDLVVRADGK